MKLHTAQCLAENIERVYGEYLTEACGGSKLHGVVPGLLVRIEHSYRTETQIGTPRIDVARRSSGRYDGVIDIAVEREIAAPGAHVSEAYRPIPDDLPLYRNVHLHRARPNKVFRNR